MTQVTLPSITYVATQVINDLVNIPHYDLISQSMQVQFALSLASVFSRTDTTTDSERFYHTVLDLFEDIEEQEEVSALLRWWNL